MQLAQHLKATLFYLSLHRKAAEFVLHRLDGQRCEPFSCFHTESAKSQDSVDKPQLLKSSQT